MFQFLRMSQGTRSLLTIGQGHDASNDSTVVFARAGQKSNTRTPEVTWAEDQKIWITLRLGTFLDHMDVNLKLTSLDREGNYE